MPKTFSDWLTLAGMIMIFVITGDIDLGTHPELMWHIIGYVSAAAIFLLAYALDREE